MQDKALYERWWEDMAASGAAASSIEEWLRSGLIRLTARTEPHGDERPLFYPFTPYITGPDDVPRIVVDVMTIARLRSDRESRALRDAVVHVGAGWDFTDPDLCDAVRLSFEIARRLECVEICDRLCLRSMELLYAPERVLTGLADMASGMQPQGAALLDYLAHSLPDNDLQRLLPFFVSRRLELCVQTSLHDQRQLVFDVVTAHKQGLLECGDAIDAIVALTDLFVEMMRTRENAWTQEQTARLRAIKDALIDDILREDKVIREALEDLAELEDYGKEYEAAEVLLKKAA